MVSRTRKGFGERPGNTGEISEGSEKRNKMFESKREKGIRKMERKQGRDK